MFRRILFLLASSLFFVQEHVLVDEVMIVEAFASPFYYGALPGNGTNSGEPTGQSDSSMNFQEGQGGLPAPTYQANKANNGVINLVSAVMTSANGSGNISVMSGGTGIHGNRVEVEANFSNYGSDVPYMRVSLKTAKGVKHGTFRETSSLKQSLELLNIFTNTSASISNEIIIEAHSVYADGTKSSIISKTIVLDVYSDQALAIATSPNIFIIPGNKIPYISKSCDLESLTIQQSYSGTTTFDADIALTATASIPARVIQESIAVNFGVSFGHTVTHAIVAVYTYRDCIGFQFPLYFQDSEYVKTYNCSTRDWEGNLVALGNATVHQSFREVVRESRDLWLSCGIIHKD